MLVTIFGNFITFQVKLRYQYIFIIKLNKMAHIAWQQSQNLECKSCILGLALNSVYRCLQSVNNQIHLVYTFAIMEDYILMLLALTSSIHGHLKPNKNQPKIFKGKFQTLNISTEIRFICLASNLQI